MLTLQTLACIDRYPQTCRFSSNSAAESLTGRYIARYIAKIIRFVQCNFKEMCSHVSCEEASTFVSRFNFESNGKKI